MTLDLTGGVGGVRPGSRILLWCPRASEEPRVAGLPLWRRAVYSACRAGFERLLVVTEAPAERLRGVLSADRRFEGRSLRVIGAADDWAGEVAAVPGRWVILGEDWMVDEEFLNGLAVSDGAPCGVEGVLAVDPADLARWARAGWNPGKRPPEPLAPAPIEPTLRLAVADADGARAAEDALFERLARNVTNFFARHVDRAMSRAITRRLAPYPVTPNQITLFSTLLGIIGSLILLDPSYLAGALGASLFFVHTVIDGCDGEIARLKFQESPFGAKLDLIGDNVVHAFLFPCMALRLYFSDPGGPFFVLGALAASGVVVTWFAVYGFILRAPPSPAVLRYFELFANREFAYLVLVLGLAGRLDWFVWAMAFGIWVFPVGLVGIWAWERARATPAG